MLLKGHRPGGRPFLPEGYQVIIPVRCYAENIRVPDPVHPVHPVFVKKTPEAASAPCLCASVVKKRLIATLGRITGYPPAISHVK